MDWLHWVLILSNAIFILKNWADRRVWNTSSRSLVRSSEELSKTTQRLMKRCDDLEIEIEELMREEP